MSGSPSARQGTLSGDGGIPVCCSTRTSSHSSSQSLPTAASRQSDTASRSHRARRIREHRVQILHVRSPLVGEYALELLYLQLPCKFHHYVVQQLVVRQWPCRIYYHVAEYLVVDVAVQLFQQFRTAESRVHLQEHQGNFPFRREERPASQLRPHAFPYQT